MLLGGGGHCSSVLDCLISTNNFDDVVILDSNMKIGSKVLDCSVVGDDSKLYDLKKAGFEYAFITVGSIKDTNVRRKLYRLVSSMEFKIPIVCDQSSKISEYANIGEGTFIGKNAVINANAIIGNHCIINTGSIIEHDCYVGDFSHVSVGAAICGNCKVGSDSFIGAGSTVIQGVTIGANVTVGAGSTVLHNIGDNVVVAGLIKMQKTKGY